MKFVDARPFANPETAARKLLELANAFEPIQDGSRDDFTYDHASDVDVCRGGKLPTVSLIDGGTHLPARRSRNARNCSVRRSTFTIILHLVSRPNHHVALDFRALGHFGGAIAIWFQLFFVSHLWANGLG